MSPIIAIPAQWAEGFEEDGAASACRQAYVESIVAAGGTPLIVPLGLSEKHWAKLFSLCDGIFLTGGFDVEPSLYEQAPHLKLGRTLSERDRLEIWFVRRAFTDNKPLLGICRGLQLMNVALGGSLYQDLPDQFVSSIKHSSNGEDKWQELPHEIEISPDSKLAAILNCESLSVNSLHHQAALRIAEGLNISAKSPDGLIEALEAKDKKFFIGIQSHPEALWQNQNKVWLNLFDSFIAAC